MDRFIDILYTLLPLAVLSVAIAIGYYFAWTDFRPKQALADESFTCRVRPISAFSPSSRALSDQELGLHEIGDSAGLSSFDQRRLKMEEKIRQYSQESPDEAASVIKGWLRDI